MARMPPKMSYSQLVEQAVAMLSRVGISHAKREALWILESGLHVTRLDLLTQSQEFVNQDDCRRVLELLARRATREPLQYVLGTQDFCGREFVVKPGVLIPRPETELVIEEVLKWVQAVPSPVFVDVGTGSGCLAISLAGARPDSTVVGIDQSRTALHLAQINAVRHGLEARIRWVNGDLITPLLSTQTEGKVTAIVANLPYISQAEWERLPPDVKDFEPRLALYGGPDGFDPYRRLLAQVPHVLTPEGALVIEIGMGQVPLVEQAVSNVKALRIANIRQDGQNIARVVSLQIQTE